MLLHSPGSVLFTKSREQLFLGWKLGCSMINENLISLLFGPQAKRRKRQHMCLSCVQNSLKVTHCLQAKVRTPWLAFKAFLVGPQPEILTFSDLKPLSQPDVLSLTQWVLPICLPGTPKRQCPSLLSAEPTPLSLEDPA